MIYFDYDGTSGQEGRPGRDGHAGHHGTNGGNGTDGTHGTSGRNASNLALELQVENNKIIMIELNKGNQYSSLPLGNSSNQISLSAKGGKGGSGGRGGHGGRGGDGHKGADATRSSQGQDGGDGGDGGYGGNGGHGANGGDGAVISVRVGEQDMDLLMIVEKYSCSGGAGGSAGHGGSAGSGGSAGRGGNSYSWTVKDRDGRTERFRNEGGRSGCSGRSGSSGYSGVSGQRGSDGDFYYIVGGQRFNYRYNLKLEKVQQIKSDDNIIEPGELLFINYMEIKNTGGMPTPIYQKINLSVVGNQYVEFNKRDTHQISQSIPASSTYQLPQPLKIQIQDNIESSIDSVFKVDTSITYDATIERINKSFEQFSTVKTSLQIRYPVELSLIQCLRSIQPKEEAPIAFSIWNRSSKPIGFETMSQRLLNVRILLNNQKHVLKFCPKSVFNDDKERRNALDKASLCYSKENFINAIPGDDDKNILLDQEFITDLQPNEKRIISGTLKFIDLDLPFYAKYDLQVHLDFGFFHNQTNLYQTIQTRNFQIQLTQPYEYKQNSEFLLIINSETKKKLIYSIKQFAYSFGSHVDIWNISNYQGFDYNYISNADNTFYELYKDKVVIILCNSYDLPNGGGANQNAIHQIGEGNIYNASKFHSIRQYILGQRDLYKSQFVTAQNLSQIQTYERQVELENSVKKRFKRDSQPNKINGQELQGEALISRLKEQQAYTFNFMDTFYCCSELKKEHIEKKCKQVLNAIDQQNCQFQHKVFYQFDNQLIKKSCLSRSYKVGNIKVVEMLRKDQAQIIERDGEIKTKKNLDSIDKFNMIKLLPFQKKLLALVRSLHNLENAKIAIDCIISDLVDEFIAFSNVGISSSRYATYLKNWVSLKGFDFQNYFQINKVELNNIKIENDPLNQEQPKEDAQETKVKIREYFQTLIFTLSNILLKQLGCLSKLFCCGKKAAMVSFCCYSLRQTSQKVFQDKKHIDKINNSLKANNLNLKAKQHTLLSLQQPYLEYQNYYKDCMFVSNVHTKSEVVSTQNYGIFYHNINDQLNKIQDGSFFFLDEINQLVNQEKRQTKVEQFEQKINYQ